MYSIRSKGSSVSTPLLYSIIPHLSCTPLNLTYGRPAAGILLTMLARLLTFSLLPAYLTGFEFYVGLTDLTPNSNVVKWINVTFSNGTRWANGLSIGFPPTYNMTDLVRLTDLNLRLLPCVHGNLESFQRQLIDHDNYDDSLEPYMYAYTTVLTDMMNATSRSVRPFWWWAFTEEDSSGVAFPYNQLSVKPSDITAAYIQWDMFLTRTLSLTNTLLSDVPKIAQVGFGEYAHSYAARNVDLLLIERANDDIGDLSTAIAFARGASRQFSVSWGIDLSWWWGVVYSGVNNMPALYHRRHAILSYFSGAYAMNIEGGDGLVDATGNYPTLLGTEMQKIGEFLNRYQERRAKQEKIENNPKRVRLNYRFPTVRSPHIHQLGDIVGDCITPVVLVLPIDHGYQTRPYWQTQATSGAYARLPPRQGDSNIGSFFAHVFPGANFAQDAFPFGLYENNDPPASPFAESAITERYAPTPDDVYTAVSSIPFGTFTDRNAAAAYFQSGSIDPSPWRPMADSRYGDIFDVMITDIGLSSMSSSSGIQPNNVFQAGKGKNSSRKNMNRQGKNSDVINSSLYPSLSNYSVAFLMGPVNLTWTLKESLFQYAAEGGIVVVPVGVVGPNDTDLIGATIVPELRTGRAWVWGNETILEPFRYTPLSASDNCGSLSNCTVIATTTNTDQPLLIQHTIGKGSVVTCLIPWFIGPENTLTKLSLRLLEEIITPLQPVTVTNAAWPVDYVSTYDESSGKFIVSIANNEGNTWNGIVNLNTQVFSYQWNNCEELLSGIMVPTINNGTAYSVSVGSYDVIAVECDLS